MNLTARIPGGLVIRALTLCFIFDTLSPAPVTATLPAASRQFHVHHPRPGHAPRTDSALANLCPRSLWIIRPLGREPPHPSSVDIEEDTEIPVPSAAQAYERRQ